MAAASPGRGSKNYLRMACTTASTSFRERLSADELVQALLTGRVPVGRRPHLRCLIKEAPPGVIRGLVQDVGASVGQEVIARNLANIAKEVGAEKSLQRIQLSP